MGWPTVDISPIVYLRDMSRSMEGSPATFELLLPVGDLIVLNNHFWVHGQPRSRSIGTCTAS